jgi:hypothetical protein
MSGANPCQQRILVSKEFLPLKNSVIKSTLPPENSSGRIWVQPLSRNTAQGASRIQDVDGATSIRGLRVHHVVFFIFFFFVGLVAMILFLLV